MKIDIRNKLKLKQKRSENKNELKLDELKIKNI